MTNVDRAQSTDSAGRRERAQRLNAAYTADEELKRRLEERTAELRRSNESLEREISERTRLERVLRNSEERFRSQYKGIPVPTYTWQRVDDDFVLVDYNDAALEITRGKIPEVVGVKAREFYFDEPQILDDIVRCYVQRRPMRQETWYRFRTTGDEKLLSVNCVFVPPDLVMVHAEDITERKRVEEQTRQRLGELARCARLSTTGQLIAELAHEMSQPLFAIINYAEACCETFRSGAAENAGDLLRWMTEVRQQANRAGMTLRRLRRLVRKTRPHWSTVQMNELIEEVVELIVPGARRSRAQIHFHPAESLPPVVVNQIEIEQVIVNLVQNAIQAVAGVSADRRTVAIETSSDEENLVQIAVADNGEGIAPELLDRVFEPFYTTKSDGIGMGLAICRSIVENHGGRLWAAQNPDHGSTFSFTIPTPGQEDHTHGK